MIRKRGSQYVILSKKTHKVLGKFKTKKAALKRLGQIEFFKHFKK
jgi:hypothetical protein